MGLTSSSWSNPEGPSVVTAKIAAECCDNPDCEPSSSCNLPVECCEDESCPQADFCSPDCPEPPCQTCCMSEVMHRSPRTLHYPPIPRYHRLGRDQALALPHSSGDSRTALPHSSANSRTGSTLPYVDRNNNQLYRLWAQSELRKMDPRRDSGFSTYMEMPLPDPDPFHDAHQVAHAMSCVLDPQLASQSMPVLSRESPAPSTTQFENLLARPDLQYLLDTRIAQQKPEELQDANDELTRAPRNRSKSGSPCDVAEDGICKWIVHEYTTGEP